MAIDGTVRGVCILGIVSLLASVGTGDVVSPPVPDNAALLYYQARLKMDEIHVSEDLSREITLFVMHGRDPTEQVRDFLNKSECQEVMFLMDRAGEMSRCDWGLLFSGRWMPDGCVATSLPFLSHLLAARAGLLALDGQHRQALEKALAIQRFARHIGDDTYAMWATSAGVDVVAFRTIQYVLGKMPPAADTLTWLKEQVEREQGAQWQSRRTLQKWRDIDVWEWQADPARYAEWKALLPRTVEDEALRKKMEALTQAQVVELVRVQSAVFVKSCLEILENDAPYQERVSQLSRLIEHPEDLVDPRSSDTTLGWDGLFGPYYWLHVNAIALQNAVRAAMEIYLVCAETGQLPPTLPDGLPRDPYSGEDFEYQVTKDGFTLRCRAKAISYEKLRQFDFRVAR